MARSKSPVNLQKSTIKYPESKDDVSGWCKQVMLATARSMWGRMEEHDLKKRHVGHVINRTETLSGAWGHVQSPTASRLSRVCKSTQDDLYGTFKTLIKAIFAAVMQTTVVCAVWNSLTTAAAGLEPTDDGWVTSEVQQRKATVAIVMAEAMLKKESH